MLVRESRLADGQRRPSLTKALEVAGIVVEDAVLPASKRDSNPLEGERPYSSVVAYAALALLLIVSTSPVTETDGVSSPFLEGLPKEFRTSPAVVNPGGLSAAHQNGSNPTELLYLGRRSISVPLRAKGSKQARSQYRTSSGERIKDCKIGMCRRRLLNLAVERGDAFSEGGDQWHQNAHHGDRGLDYCRIPDCRNFAIHAAASFWTTVIACGAR